jgi:radical SAM superfamily enzyme YgiQ (UPF0313 family)
MKKIIIGSAQINNGFAGQYYLPYSIGILQSYFIHNTKKNENYEFRDIIYKRLPLHKNIEQLKDCDIILFSIYVWNKEISLKIAEELKKIDKKKFIIFGGPSVPDPTDGKAELFLKKYNFIDICVHQEGERTTFELLDNFPNLDYSKIPNISYLDLKKIYKNNSNLPRLNSFEKVPSPYLCGIFDELIKKNPTERWLASWETNRGCPFSCAYCDWGSATNSKVARMELDRIFRELDWFSINKIEFIFCCDANFGMLPRDYDIALKAVENKKKYGYPHILSVQNTKNARERSYKVQKLLAENGLSKGVTLAMQSIDSHTLKEIKRDNISIEDYQELQERFTKDGIATYTEFIIGLPGDTYESFSNGVSIVINAGQHNRIQYNNLSILPNAEMGSNKYLKKHKIVTVEIPIVNPHGSLDEIPSDGVYEKQELVISTKDLSIENWKKTRVYASVSEFFYFNKVMQIPILFLNKLLGLSFKKIFEDLMDAKNDNKYKILKKIIEYFYHHAENITKGNSEFCYHKDWLKIYWPPGEYEYIKILKQGNFDILYEELGKFLSEYLINKNKDYKKIFEECLMLNKHLMRRPFERENVNIKTDFNIIECYNLIKQNLPYEIVQKNSNNLIIKNDFFYDNWDDWMREVIWYGHRSGKYICKIETNSKNDAMKHNIVDSNIIGNSYIV